MGKTFTLVTNFKTTNYTFRNNYYCRKCKRTISAATFNDFLNHDCI